MARIAKAKKQIFLDNAKKTIETAINEKAYIKDGNNYYIDFRDKRIIECNLHAFDYGVLFYRSLTLNANVAFESVMTGRKTLEEAMQRIEMMLANH